MAVTLLEKFEKFDSENPGIYFLFKRFATDLINAGRTKLSAALIVERIRWEVNISTKSDDVFKLSNNHTAFYARKYMEDHPEHGEIFRTRTQLA
jgi:hypothetical protein